MGECPVRLHGEGGIWRVLGGQVCRVWLVELRGWLSREEKTWCRTHLCSPFIHANITPELFQLPQSLPSYSSSKLFISKTNLEMCLGPKPTFPVPPTLPGGTNLLQIHNNLQNGLSQANCRSPVSSWDLFLFQPYLHSLLLGSFGPLGRPPKNSYGTEASRICPMGAQKDLSCDLLGTAQHTEVCNKSVLSFWTREWLCVRKD